MQAVQQEQQQEPMDKLEIMHRQAVRAEAQRMFDEASWAVFHLTGLKNPPKKKLQAAKEKMDFYGGRLSDLGFDTTNKWW